MSEHTAKLFNDYGWASGRGWYILHSETCKSLDGGGRCDEPEDVTEVKAAVMAIYDAHPWPYPAGLWPVPVGTPMNKEFEFTVSELRDHLADWLETQADSTA